MTLIFFVNKFILTLNYLFAESVTAINYHLYSCGDEYYLSKPANVRNDTKLSCLYYRTSFYEDCKR